MAPRTPTVLLVTAALASLLLWGATRDAAPLFIYRIAVPYLEPGFLLRGALSRSELGFQDWRDIALAILAPAMTWTGLYILAWRVRKRLSRGVVA
jgi:hypothetical protein